MFGITGYSEGIAMSTAICTRSGVVSGSLTGGGVVGGGGERRWPTKGPGRMNENGRRVGAGVCLGNDGFSVCNSDTARGL